MRPRSAGRRPCGGDAKREGEELVTNARSAMSFAARAAGILVLLGAGCGGSEPPARAVPGPPGGEPEEAATRGFVRDLGAADFHAFIQSRTDAFVLDVRLPPEWDDEFGHLEFATQIPVQELELRLSELPSDKYRPILIYDRTGLRSTQAAELLAAHGYREIYTLLGGLAAYRQAGY